MSRYQADDRLFLEVRPHETRLRAGAALQLDVFVHNVGNEPFWVQGQFDYLDFEVRTEQGEYRDYPGWKREEDPFPPVSRDDFVRLKPGMSLACFHLTGDRLVLPEPGRFTILVWNSDYEAHVCADCHQIDYVSPKSAQFEVVVE